MDLKGLSKPLSANQIDFRVQGLISWKQGAENKFAVNILAYKDARVDMQRLDEVAGALNWKREHTRDNRNCVVSIWDEQKKMWVSKEDTGTESNTEKEKGLASDSFKRACFNWGIGRELYDYPVIMIPVTEADTYNGKLGKSWQNKFRKFRWTNQFDENGNLTFLGCTDTNNNVVWKWGELHQTSTSQK